MNVGSFILLCIFALLWKATLVTGYSNSGATAKEIPLKVAKHFPNEFSGHVSVFESITYRMDLAYVDGYNSSVDRVQLSASVEEDTPLDFPIFVSFVQRHESLSLQLPYVFRDDGGLPLVNYTKASQSICVPQKTKDNYEGHVLIKVSTGSYQKLLFKIKVVIAESLLSELGRSKSFMITPTTPTYYYIPFPEIASRNIAVRVDSKKHHCLAVSIHQPNCIGFDTGIKPIAGLDVTTVLVRQNGVIHLDTKQYLHGSFVKFQLLQDDSKCGVSYNSVTNGRKEKSVSFNITEDPVMSVNDGYFWINVGAPPLLGLIVGIVVGGIYIVSYAFTRGSLIKCETLLNNKMESIGVSVQTWVNRGSQVQFKGLSTYGRWTLIISIFFLIPIVDQSIYNAMAYNGLGSHGGCNFNNLCSHPVWIFKDFNHLWSNTSNLTLGFAIICITGLKHNIQKKGNEKQNEGVFFHSGLYYAMGLGMIFHGLLSSIYHICPKESNAQYDTDYLTVLFAMCSLKLYEFRRPQRFALSTSVGILGICFLLTSLRLAIERHFETYKLAAFVFRILISVLHGVYIFYCCIYSLYIGFPIRRLPSEKSSSGEEILGEAMGRSILYPTQRYNDQPERTRLPNINQVAVMKSFSDIPRFLWIFPKLWQWKMPVFILYRIVFVLLLLGLNGFLIYYSYSPSLYVMTFFAFNFALNFSYYFVMKFVFGEFACRLKSIQVFFNLIIALCLTSLSVYLFVENYTVWMGGEITEDCFKFPPLSFYDKHDAWHMLTAHAFFFVFMVLLSIDDGIERVGREFIGIF